MAIYRLLNSRYRERLEIITAHDPCLGLQGAVPSRVRPALLEVQQLLLNPARR
jgi:hypothetical protein